MNTPIISIYAQCSDTQIHTRDDGTSNTSNIVNAQTFTACADAEIISISVTASSHPTFPSPSGVYNLYIGVEPGDGASLPTTTPLATRTFASNPNPLEVITFTLNSPFSITNGIEYRFYVEFSQGTFDGGLRRHENSSDYADGVMVTNNADHFSRDDLDFQINTLPTASNDVPTLSEWGLIILALSFMTLGTLYLLQPSKRFEQER